MRSTQHRTALGARWVDGVAINTISKRDRDTYLRERDVTLLGGAIDEAPQVYKDIDAVISAQDELVEILGKFSPRIVRMADEAGEY